MKKKSKLEGQLAKLTPSDPWRLSEAVKERTLVGVINREAVWREPNSSQENHALLMELQTPLVLNDTEFRWIHVSARYEGESVHDLRGTGDKLVASFICIPQEQYVEDSTDLSWWRGGAAFLGELELI